MTDNNDIEFLTVPQHVAIILDGNRRWARLNNVKYELAYQKSVLAIEEIFKYSTTIGIKYLTLYAFSTDNLSRTDPNVSKLYKFIFDSVLSKADLLHKFNTRLNIVGQYEHVFNDVNKIIQLQEETKHYSNFVLTIAVCYDFFSEMVDAVKNIIKKNIPAEKISEDLILEHLYTKDIPNIDLLIRPGQEKRISSFMLWKIAYSELFFSDVLMPDFTPAHMKEIIKDFNCRERRYGS